MGWMMGPPSSALGLVAVLVLLCTGVVVYKCAVKKRRRLARLSAFASAGVHESPLLVPVDEEEDGEENFVRRRFRTRIVPLIGRSDGKDDVVRLATRPLLEESNPPLGGRFAILERSFSSDSTTSTMDTAARVENFDDFSNKHRSSICHISRRFAKRSLVGFTLLVSMLCMMTLVLSPADAVITICDFRLDLGSLKQDNARTGKMVQILAELSVSIWNPNHFDVETYGAKGTVLFQQGAVARFHWEPRDGIFLISSGHVADVRITIAIDWNSVADIPLLLEEWATKDGVVMSLETAAFLRVRLFGLNSPRLSLPSTSALHFNDANRDMCLCTVE